MPVGIYDGCCVCVCVVEGDTVSVGKYVGWLDGCRVGLFVVGGIGIGVGNIVNGLSVGLSFIFCQWFCLKHMYTYWWNNNTQQTTIQTNKQTKQKKK